MKFIELKDMSDDQLAVTLREAKDTLFRLRLQSRMERLDSPSELRKNKKLIARILTIQNQKNSQKNKGK